MSRKHRGFTIVELMLAMTVLSVLLLAIAMLVIQIGRVYTKGVTLKSLNQVATTMSRDIQNTLNQSEAGLTQQVKQATKSGRLCTGYVSYVWNAASDTPNGALGPNVYAAPNDSKALRFAKVPDKDNVLCRVTQTGSYAPVSYDETTELLPPGQYDFSAYEFYVGSSSSSPLRWVVMKIGTMNADTDAQAQECLIGASGLGDYCAINIFEFTAGSR